MSLNWDWFPSYLLRKWHISWNSAKRTFRKGLNFERGNENVIMRYLEHGLFLGYFLKFLNEKFRSGTSNCVWGITSEVSVESRVLTSEVASICFLIITYPLVFLPFNFEPRHTLELSCWTHPFASFLFMSAIYTRCQESWRMLVATVCSRFGTWPVAMLGESKAKTLLEGPVCKEKRVIGWHTSEKSYSVRRFHVGMSGFAFNSTIIWETVNWRHRGGQPIRQLDTVQEGLQVCTGSVYSVHLTSLMADNIEVLTISWWCIFGTVFMCWRLRRVQWDNVKFEYLGLH